MRPPLQRKASGESQAKMRLRSFVAQNARQDDSVWGCTVRRLFLLDTGLRLIDAAFDSVFRMKVTRQGVSP